jgi:regulator of ribonuclease activity A
VKSARATADLCDAFPGRVRVVAPLFRDWGGISSFSGPIETIRVFEDNALVRQALEGEGHGRVLVVDGGGSLRTALVGGRLAGLARDHDWTAVVVNGCIRDVVEIGSTPVGVRALGASPMKSGSKGTGERSVSVTFAGVTFTPGEWLYADADGLLVADGELPAD